MKLFAQIRDIIKKGRHIWVLVLLMAGLAFMSGWIYLHNVRDAQNDIEVTRINEDYTVCTEAISSDSEIRQPFSTDAPVYGGSFIFTTYDEVCYGTMTLELQDSAGTVLASKSVDATTLLDNTYRDVPFDNVVVPDGETTYCFVIRFTPHPAQAGRLGVWSSAGTVEGLLPMSINGRQTDRTLGFSIITNRVGHWIVGAYWAIVAFAALALAAGYWLVFVKQAELPVVFAFFAITLGIVYLFAMPPYVAPDEDTHVHSAYELSNQMFGIQKDNRIWMRSSDTIALDRSDEVDAFSYQFYAQQLFGRCEDSTMVKTDYIAASVFFVQYLPSALVISVCRLVNLNYVTMIFLGRIVNLLVYTALMALSIRIMPKFKRILVVIGLLPMCLHLAASYNYDAMLIGIACIFFALVLHYAYEKPKLGWRDLLLLAAVIVLMSPMKMLYVLLVPFCLIIPLKKCPPKTNYLILVMLALGIVFCIIFFPYILRYIGVTPESLATAAQKAVPQVNPLNIDYLVYDFWDMSYVLTHLSGAVKMFFLTVQENTMLYFIQLVGGELGEPILNDLMVWAPAVVGLWVVLILSAVPAGDETPLLGRKQKVWGGFVLFLVFAALLVIVYRWTPMRDNILWGMQGRYWLPCLPLAMLVLQGKVLHLEHSIERPLIMAEACFSLISIASVFQDILSQAIH